MRDASKYTRGFRDLIKRIWGIYNALVKYVAQLNQIQKEMFGYKKKADIYYQGLTKLKLGKITVSYEIKGRARSAYLKRRRVFKESGKIEKSGTGPNAKRLIAIKKLKGKYTRAVIKCYSYRGFRTRSDRDFTQGRGIPKVMRMK